MHTTSAKLLRRASSAVLVAGLLLGTAACGDDDDATAASPTTAEQTTTTAAADPTEPADGGEHDHVEVTAVDFAFQDLPAEIKAGTRLSLVNGAETELHELVAFRLPEEETRSVDDLMALPPAEQQALLADVEPQTVLLAEPGGEQIPAVGDGTLTEPGRYIVLCAIPTGVSPADYLAAAAQSQGGPPEIEGAGPPHMVHGMYAELSVVE